MTPMPLFDVNFTIFETKFIFSLLQTYLYVFCTYILLLRKERNPWPLYFPPSGPNRILDADDLHCAIWCSDVLSRFGCSSSVEKALSQRSLTKTMHTKSWSRIRVSVWYIMIWGWTTEQIHVYSSLVEVFLHVYLLLIRTYVRANACFTPYFCCVLSWFSHGSTWRSISYR
jgi:hypothetical protein